MSKNLLKNKILESTNCDNATVIGGYTPLDMRNVSLYVQMKWKEKRCIDLKSSGVDVAWQDNFEDGVTSYYCPPGATGCFDGKCIITSSTECLKHSVYPYSTDSDGNPVDNPNNLPYLEFRLDEKYPQAGARCYFGNSELKKWCISPAGRNPPDDKAPPFGYDSTSGRCFVSKDYCDNKGYSYSRPDVAVNIDGVGATTNYGGKCYETTGMSIAETLFGATLTRGIAANCDILSDKKFKKKLIKVCEDYISKGINLYIFEYSEEALKLHPNYKRIQIGFLADELKKEYPEIIEKKDGRLYISIPKEKLKDKKYWRIYNTLQFREPLLKKYFNIVLDNKNE
jgi:hypothetical protein